MCTKKARTLLAGHATFPKDCVTRQKSVCERGYQAVSRSFHGQYTKGSMWNFLSDFVFSTCTASVAFITKTKTLIY